MTGLQEYDIEIKTIHVTKGHGLYKLAAEVVHTLEVNKRSPLGSRKLKCMI